MSKGKFFGKVLNFMGLEEYESDYEDDQMQDDEIDMRMEREIQDVSVLAQPPRGKRGNVVAMPNQNAGNGYMKMMVYLPTSFEDTQSIIDNLKAHKPIILNLENMDVDMAQRILDFMAGGIYALSGTIYKVSKGIFVLAPNNVDISGNQTDELIRGRGFFSVGGRRE